MDLLDLGRILLGLVLLVGGGELLVRGASAIASRAGISPLVVGLTVVSVATSAPELAVTMGAVLDDQPDLAVGNVVGSNIANVLLILGIAALVLPLVVKEQLVKLDVPAMVGLSLVLLLFAVDGTISTLEGAVLLTLMVLHTTVTVLVSRRDQRREAVRKRRGVGRPQRPDGDGGGEAGESAQAQGQGQGQGDATPAEGQGETRPGVLRAVVYVVVGVALLVFGADQLVTGAVSVAEELGVSGLVVGLTVVAVGTSLPELAASVIAALRGERDLAVGNVVGSCIANIGLVLGLPAIISSGGLPVPGAAAAFDIPVMLAAAVALAPVVFTGFAVARWEAGVFVLLYVAYTAYVVLGATGHDALEGFTTMMAVFVLPLVVITLVAAVGYELGRRAERRARGLDPDPDPEARAVG